ncbi:hypothetical protein PENNAL_c0019G06307 [Penicillium nalgiovense]|uniref:Uncharacterized protein n=1 Tax=Penicillium nalgiovense TaxID=60175 RepID=A0A1V6YJR4_PENNA|nr:hypothetical protein PENNAL_c0019G06307 [Penicillium nalgiovense]
MATQSTSEQADNPPRYDSIQPRSAVIDCMQAPAAPAAPERTIPRESPWLLPVINPTLLSIKRLCIQGQSYSIPGSDYDSLGVVWSGIHCQYRTDDPSYRGDP